MRSIAEITINGTALSEILDLHKKWLVNNGAGERANLRDADLSDADLSDANLRYADLRYANLRDANLRYADLRDANLRYAKNIPDYVLAITSILPDGNIIGWKKCYQNVIVKMQIPARAKRSNATGRKCRAEFVKVLALYDGNQEQELPADTIAITTEHGPKTEYQKGKIVKCDKFDTDRWQECSGGIHFFITRYEADQY